MEWDLSVFLFNPSGILFGAKIVSSLDENRFHPNLHTRRSSTQGDIYQMSY